LEEAEDDERARLEIPDDMLDSTEAHDLRLNADLIDDDDLADLLGDFSRGELSGVLADPALAAGGVLDADESAWLPTAGTGRGNPSVMSGGGGPGKSRPPYESSAEEDPGE
jgi:hypothetical protein